MGTVVKKEVYTTRQPDGSLVTTTTKTTTEQDTVHDDFEFGVSAFNAEYCCTPSAWLRIFQIVVGFVVVGCVSGQFGTSFNGVLQGQHFVLVQACLFICLTFILLIIFLLGIHRTHLSEMPWRAIDLWCSIIACILNLVAGCLEAWYASGTWRPNCNQFRPPYYACPVFIAWAVASAFCFLNAILYAIGAWCALAKRYYR